MQHPLLENEAAASDPTAAVLREEDPPDDVAAGGDDIAWEEGAEDEAVYEEEEVVDERTDQEIRAELDEEGVTTIVAFRCGIPGGPRGMQFTLMMHFISTLTALISIAAVFKQGSVPAAVILTIIYLRGIYLERAFWHSSQDGEGRDVTLPGPFGCCIKAVSYLLKCNLLPKQVNFTCTRGIISPRLALALSTSAIKHKAFLLLLAPWATLEKTFPYWPSPLFWALYNIGMFVLAAKALCEENMCCHLGGVECSQLGMAMVQKTASVSVRQQWYLRSVKLMTGCEILATTTVNAMVMLLLTTTCGRVEGPCAGLTLFLPNIFALYWTLGHTGEEPITERKFLMKSVFLQPLHWFTFPYSSLFRLPAYSVAALAQYGNRPAFAMVCATFVRFAISIAVVIMWAEHSDELGPSSFLVDDWYTFFLKWTAMFSTPVYLVLLGVFTYSQKDWRKGSNDLIHEELDGDMVELIMKSGLSSIDADL